MATNHDEFTDWIADEIRYVCETYKERSAGSESERACGDYMAEQLSRWSDTVEKEDYAVHPHAFTGAWAFSASAGIGSILCFVCAAGFSLKWLLWASVLFALAAIAVYVLEHALYRQFMDFLYPKYQSQNVMAVRKAQEETKQRIIFCGHADAAYEMPLIQKAGAATIAIMSFFSGAGLLWCLAAGLVTAFADLSQPWVVALCVGEALFIIPFSFFLFFVDWKTVVDGANDNLTGCFLGMSILKEMAEKNQRLKNTDVCCLITGGEECGLRGAFAYAKAHRQELLDTNSIVIAVDTIHEKDQLMIYSRGIYGTQKNSEAVCALLRAAGKECGLAIRDAGFYPGANDSEAFSRNGIEAAALCAVRHAPASYYHTVTDTWDNLDKDCLALTREILTASARRFDQRDHSR